MSFTSFTARVLRNVEKWQHFSKRLTQSYQKDTGKWTKSAAIGGGLVGGVGYAILPRYDYSENIFWKTAKNGTIGIAGGVVLGTVLAGSAHLWIPFGLYVGVPITALTTVAVPINIIRRRVNAPKT